MSGYRPGSGYSLSRKILEHFFGKQEGDKLWDVGLVLFGLVGLVVSLVAQWWTIAALCALVVAMGGVSLFWARQKRWEESEGHGLRSEVGDAVASFDLSGDHPGDHEPLPPWPSPPNNEPK
jgi:hypothetical protein